MAGHLNIEIEQGADFSETFTYYPDGTTAQDWTGWTGAAQVRATYASADPVLEFDVDANSSGVVTLTASATDTAALTPGRGVWDLEMTQTSDSSVLRLLSGRVLISPEVTR